MGDHHGSGFEGCCGPRHGGARLIDARLPELARCLTLFRYVQAVTGGPVARIDQAGGYAVPSARGEAFAVRPGSIALRLDADGVDTAVLVRDEDTLAVRLLDADGRTVHQGRLLSEGDRLLTGLLGTLDAGARAGAGAGPLGGPLPEWGNGGGPARDVPAREIPAGAADGRPAQAVADGEVTAWEDGDQLAQFDAVLADGGIARRAAFGRYRGEHRPIEAGVLSAVLDHVCSVGLPIGAAVFAPSAMQACAGRVHVTDRTIGGRVFAAVAESSVEIDLSRVRACHLVRSAAAHGPTSALELDDEDGRCVAVLTQFGIVGQDVHTAWEHLADSLPDA